MFEFPTITHEYPLTDREKQAIKIVKPMRPSLWVQENLSLPEDSAYSQKGQIILDPWMIFPLDLAENPYIEEIVYMGSTQGAKSFLFELITLWFVAHYGGSFLITYQDLVTVKDSLTDKLLPVIKANKVLNRLLTDTQDDLKNNKIRLRNAFIRTGSPIRRVLASFAYNLVYLSECGKYDCKFDFVTLAKSRFNQVLSRTLLLLESSPLSEGTQFVSYCKSIKNHIYPFVQTPCCKKWVFMDDSIIKEIPNSDGSLDHSPERILSESAAYLECPHCKTRISEESRYPMLKTTIWAETADQIIDGVQPVFNIRKICVHSNRIYSHKWTFADTLAAFFSALNSEDPTSLDSYNQEVMGRATRRAGNGKINEKYILSKCQAYNQYDYDNVRYNEDIEFSIAGLDTHKDNIRFVLFGICPRTTTVYVMLEDKIEVDLESKTPFDIAEMLKSRLFNHKFLRTDNSEIPIIMAGIDRQGGYQKKVDEVCKYIPVLHPVFGTPRKNDPIIRKAKNEGWWIINSREISRTVEKFLTNGKIIFPLDISSTFITEIIGEYWETTVNTKGHQVTEQVILEENHARSCANYAFALMFLLSVWSDPGKAKRIADNILAATDLTLPNDDQKTTVLPINGRSKSFKPNRFRR